MSSSDPLSAQALIDRHGLQPHPEGGWYRELHRSHARVVRCDGQERSALTAILFLLPQGEISRWHRVRDADETWHHAGGAPLELLLLPPSGGAVQRRILAGLELAMAAHLQAPAEPLAIVPAGWWQAARPMGDVSPVGWSLVSCCVGPGFAFADFSLLRDLPPSQRPPGALDAFL